MFKHLNNKKERVNKKKIQEFPERTVEAKDGMYEKCPHCEEIYPIEKLVKNAWICPHCDAHLRMHCAERARLIFDELHVFQHTMKTKDPLNFPGYKEKLQGIQNHTGMNDAVVCGQGMIGKRKVLTAIMDPNFMMGSMGTVVGEKITRLFEMGIKKKLPVIIFSASGGARMQEGMVSLMQMAKISAAIGEFNEQGGLYITVLTDPTTGGVTASFAMLGDIILAEPGALIGFAGPRVIEQTMKSTLPDGFQRAEFLLEHGFVDKVVHRKNLKQTLELLLEMHEV
ncbi:acetyl-CoA carboxylase carboxyltransferase subunit beta [Erysipelothrix inopinata]|uniref:Acetyl-coenzyme A carboxylase carboxyl transferase subunit beta n=1 Tax=Erysipelothrix inopinata TaxID=225084 RepID=A0A7G9S0V3_9FIRM|nr:acetyl-CoA carboxylase, carboxyltransferase subunit beta [Erysipelothrix inopinata]QNN61478.1 acetyl-CoA carboxylase carboxyltransferase subunit beta [Erysipelothrix inopinata]